jgi:protein-disulfide isomerase
VAFIGGSVEFWSRRTEMTTKGMTSRLILVLLTLTALMQVSIMYRQGGRTDPAVREPVRIAPEGAVVELVDMPVEGSKEASVVLIEFSDYECPFCQRHATGVGQELRGKYVTTGSIRYAFANNPLPMHQNARFMAAAAICAGQQEYYWQMVSSDWSERSFRPRT